MKMHLLWLVMPVILMMSCDKANLDPGKGKELELNDTQVGLVEQSNEFSFSFFNQANQNLTAQMNAMISPLSIQAVLAMTANGAQGDTRAQILKGIGLEGVAEEDLNQYFQLLIADLPRLDPQVTLEIGNSIWYRQGFHVERQFLNTNERLFGAEILEADFDNPGTVTKINQWASDATNGKIEQVIENLDAAAVMLLMNAVYFKGDWTEQFDVSKTVKDKFTTAAGASIETDFMWNEQSYKALRHADFDGVELPYGRGKYSMIVLKPKAEKTPRQVIEAVGAPGVWKEIIAEASETKLRLGLPKFKFSYGNQLNQALQSLGMQRPFTEEADFTRINKGGNLLISEVKHKSFVDVNEEGTEAAAVTSVVIELTSMPMPPQEIKLDEPFVFMIREVSSGLILFLGQVNDPTISSTEVL